jgi:propanol-preferring alcohol dehydrogenase
VKEIKALTGGEGAHAAVVTATAASFFQLPNRLSLIEDARYQQAVSYLRAGGTLMAVSLPGSATLDTSIFFCVFKV